MKTLITVLVLCSTLHASPRCTQNGVGGIVCDDNGTITTFQTAADTGDVLRVDRIAPPVTQPEPVNCRLDPYNIACPNPYAKQWAAEQYGLGLE